MKNVVVYYSYSGKTHRVAQVIIKYLKEKKESVTPVRIRPLKEEKNMFVQFWSSLVEKKPKLYKTLLDVEKYDRIILGSPVWAFKPAPAINTYIKDCSSLKGKKAVCFTTYKVGMGKSGTLRFMKKKLKSRGARIAKTLSFQQDENAKTCKEKLEKIL